MVMMSDRMVQNAMEACGSFYPGIESDRMRRKGEGRRREIGDVVVTIGHSCDITPLLTSLALFKGFDVCMTESVVVVGMVVTNPTDSSSFASAVWNFAVDLVMSPRAA